MQLKTFCAKTGAAALSQIRSEFGADAVILETREENGVVYITAALERQPSVLDNEHFSSAFSSARKSVSDAEHEAREERRAREERGTVTPPPAARTIKATTPPARESVSPTRASAPAGNTLPKAARNTADKAYRSVAATGDNVPLSRMDICRDSLTGNVRWQEEWSCIKSHLLALMKPALRFDLLPPRQRLALEYLQKQGVDDEAMLFLYEHLRDNELSNILTPLAGLVPIRPWGKRKWPQRVQFVTGPFGAGKTSVAIRMALSLRRSSPGTRICLVNADATRGNGRLLLRHYSELSDMEYREAASTIELVAVLDKAERAGFDRVLVDLPGLGRTKHLRSLLSDAGMDERLGNGPDSAAVHLALPPLYSDVETRNLLERYHSDHTGSIIWTRLDEASQFGQIVNVGAASGLPVSAVSYGPGLRRSFTPASQVLLWRLLFKQELPGDE